jgi:NADP-dependent 3-hydroxy acid dehydrogenase YdfG
LTVSIFSIYFLYIRLKKIIILLKLTEKYSLSRDTVMKLKDKVAIITGAGDYLGRGMALCFAEEGARVMVNDKTLEKAKETIDLFAARKGHALSHSADVEKTNEVNDMITKVIKE